MEWSNLALLVTSAFAAMGFVSFVTNRAYELFLLAIAALALSNFKFYALGTLWIPLKAITPWVLLLVIVRANDFSLSRVRLSAWWCLLISVLLACVVAFVIEIPFSVDRDGLRSSAIRPIVQLYTYASGLALAPLAILALQSERDLWRFWNFYGLVAIASCAIGLVQLAFLRSGIPFMPILRGHGKINVAASFGYDGEVVYRVYALAGEPKHLAAFLIPITFASLIAFLQANVSRPWWAHPAIAAIFLLMIVLTYSTGALLALVAGFLTLLIFVTSHGLWHSGRLFGTLSMIVAITLLFMLGSGVLGLELDVFDLFWHRTADRLELEIGDRPETAALHYLFVERPELLLTGVGLGMFPFHLPRLLTAADILPIQSGWVTTLMDAGLFGVIALIALCAGPVITCSRFLRWLPAEGKMLLAMGIAAVIGSGAMHSGWNIVHVIALFVGVLRATMLLYQPAPGDIRWNPAALGQKRGRPS